MNLIFNEVVETNNVTDAFDEWYDLLLNNKIINESEDDEWVPVRNKGIGEGIYAECLNATTIINNPYENICQSKIRNMSMKYAIGELLWYISCNNSFKAIKPYSSFWEKISDDGYTVNSNYGHCIRLKYGFDQFEYCIKLLIENPSTRQAIIHIKGPSEKASKDVNCTETIQLFIRDEKVHMTVNMRSNDIWLGFPYDVFQFTCLQILVAMRLDLEVGTYTHNVGSLHLYEKDVIR